MVWTGTGTKTITLNVTDNGCVSPQVTQQLTINPLPVADAGPDVTVCSGGAVQLGSAPVGGYSYLWFPAANLSSDAVANPNFSNTNSTGSPVTSNYVLAVVQNGCAGIDSALVTVNPPSATTISTPGVTAICNGQNIVI